MNNRKDPHDARKRATNIRNALKEGRATGATSVLVSPDGSIVFRFNDPSPSPPAANENEWAGAKPM